MNEMGDTGRPIYLADILLPLREHWLKILAAALLGGIIAAAAAFYMQPIYRAEVLLAPVDKQEVAGGLSGIGGQLGMVGAWIAGSALSAGSDAEALATLESRALAQEFIVEMELMPVFFEDAWDIESAEWKVFEDDVPTLGQAFKFFDKKVRSIDQEWGKGLVLLAIEWRDPVLAKEWANAFVDKANRTMRASAAADAAKNIEYLQDELKKTNVMEVRQAIYSVMESQMRKIMLANVQEQYAFKVIDPAVVPDPDDYVRPKRFFIIILGLLIGFLAAAIPYISIHQRL